MNPKPKLVSRAVLVPFILVTSLFFAWGFANDITNPMVKAFSKIFRMSTTDGALVQLAFYGGYFAMAFPAALFIRKFSYKSGTLVGLLGTVIGMIRAFAALANAGAPDSIALSTGISEALINTAFGIATGACAVISYNYYTSKIDKLTYSIDEVGFTIVSAYAVAHK